MSKWLQRAEQMAGDKARANSAISAKSPPNGTNGTNGTGLPPLIAMGLRSIEGKPPGDPINAQLWSEIVRDALALRDGGWAGSALALGWGSLDLFGLSDLREGLAVWLRGRRIVLLDATTAVVEDGDRRCQFTRCRNGMPGGKHLWEIGR